MLTRAKSLLVLIGHEPTLKKNKLWSIIIDNCKKHRALNYFIRVLNSGKQIKNKFHKNVTLEQHQMLYKTLIH